MGVRPLILDFAEPQALQDVPDVVYPHLVGDDVVEDDVVIRGERTLSEGVIDD
jgi:hypothetical protein